MATRRYANSDERVGASASFGADFDVDENWHVDFGQAGVRQMSVREIAEAWHAGAVLATTPVWHAGLTDWEDALSVPQIARAIDALSAQSSRYAQANDEIDDGSSDWDATVVETRSRGAERRDERRLAPKIAPSPHSLPPRPNARSVSGPPSSSLPPLPDAKAAFRTHDWAQPTPPPPDLSLSRGPRSERTESARGVDSARFPRPVAHETPELPTVKAPPVEPISRRERAPVSTRPSRPNPSSVASPATSPLSVVRVGGTSKPPPLPPSEPAPGSSRRLMIWGVLGGIGIGVVILFLWRLIVPGHSVEEATLSSESIESTASSASDDEAVVSTRPAEPPKPVAAATSQIVEVHPAEPPVVAAPAVVPSEPEPSAETQASAPIAAKNELVAAPIKAPEKAEAPRAEEPKRVVAPAKQDSAPPPPKEKPVVASAPVVSEPKPVVAPPTREEEEEPPAAQEPEPPAPPSAPNPGFNKDAAVATLNTAAAAAARCPKDATGPGTARVIFDPDGSVRSVSIVSGDFEATAAGTCVTRAFERCKVPPFSGKPAAVSRRFEIKPKPPEE